MTEVMQNGTISGFPDPAARLVRKGSNFESLFGGLSPSVSARPSMVSQYTFLNAQDRNRSNEVWAVMGLRISEYKVHRTFTLDRKKAIPKSFICNFAYSALASFRIGMSGSASFQSARGLGDSALRFGFSQENHVLLRVTSQDTETLSIRRPV